MTGDEGRADPATDDIDLVADAEDLRLRRVHLSGVRSPGWNPVNNAWEYDPATDEWKELAPMPTKRGAASAGVANGKIYVTGGSARFPA